MHDGAYGVDPRKNVDRPQEICREERKGVRSQRGPGEIAEGHRWKSITSTTRRQLRPESDRKSYTPAMVTQLRFIVPKRPRRLCAGTTRILPLGFCWKAVRLTSGQLAVLVVGICKPPAKRRCIVPTHRGRSIVLTNLSLALPHPRLRAHHLLKLPLCHFRLAKPE